MGFMDKAKKLAEQGKVLADQAQVKLDEAQKQFNDRQGSGSTSTSSAGGVGAADLHGRPVAEPADAAHPAATPQQGDPLSEVPPAPPADQSSRPQPEDHETPHGDPLADSAPSAPKPPAPRADGGMTSGDPLAG
jgi:hypothetical protein